MSNDKTNTPDYQVNFIQEGRKGDERWTPVGAAWEGRDGYVTVDSVFGKFVLKPKEELERLRAEKQAKQEQRDFPEREQSIK